MIRAAAGRPNPKPSPRPRLLLLEEAWVVELGDSDDGATVEPDGKATVRVAGPAVLDKGEEAMIFPSPSIKTPCFLSQQEVLSFPQQMLWSGQMRSLVNPDPKRVSAPSRLGNYINNLQGQS